MKTVLQSLLMLLLLTVLTGIIYPVVITDLSRMIYPEQASGSLIKQGDRILGSKLIAQKFEDAGFFWSRPSACDEATLPSGASNLGPTSAALAKAIDDRRKAAGAGAPGDLLTASGSGLDPDVSLEAALFQVDRVASARHLDRDKLKALVLDHVQRPQFGMLGETRVNVLALNLDLDRVR
jgi:K+-transporting ATPase ATPase C chain